MSHELHAFYWNNKAVEIKDIKQSTDDYDSIVEKLNKVTGQQKGDKKVIS